MVVRARSRSSGPLGGGGTEIITPPGDSDATVNTGTQTEFMTPNMTTTLDNGVETESMGFTPKPDVSTGTQTESFDDSDATGDGTRDTGTHTESHNGVFNVTSPVSIGSDTLSFQSDADAAVNQFTATGSNVLVSSSRNWSNPTNAEGDFDTVVADITHSGVSPTTASAYLLCDVPAINATPSGFTRTGVELRIVHDWDLDISGAIVGVTDVTLALEVWDAANTTLLQTLFTRTASGLGTDQGSLLTEDFTLTVGDSDLTAGLSVRCHFFTTGVVSGSVNGSSDWRVDGVHLRTSYSRTGIA